MRGESQHRDRSECIERYFSRTTIKLIGLADFPEGPVGSRKATSANERVWML
jgi:hypothetical protein